MTKRIFRSILAVSLAVLAASLVLVTGVLHGYFQDRVAREIYYLEFAMQETFVEEMRAASFYPHTHLELYPSVAGRL